jgi:predicted DNA binding CopG/RHH family protein
MKKLNYDDYEKNLVREIEDDNFYPIKMNEKEHAHHKTIAKNTLKKDQRVNLRITKNDLLDLKAKAVRAGLPYQTYISSLLHKFITGQIKAT